MKYLKLFENKFNSWYEIIDYIESTLVSDREEFDNIFLDWKEYIQGKSYSIGNLSMPKFVFHKIDHLNLVKKYSQDVFKGDLNRGSGVNHSSSYDIGSLLHAYILSKRLISSNYSFLPKEFDISDFQRFYNGYGVGGWERHGYELVIDWTIFTQFKSNWGYPNKSDEFIEVESLIQEVVERVEQFFGLKYSLFVRYPHDVAIFTIYFYK